MHSNLSHGCNSLSSIPQRRRTKTEGGQLCSNFDLCKAIMTTVAMEWLTANFIKRKALIREKEPGQVPLQEGTIAKHWTAHSMLTLAAVGFRYRRLYCDEEKKKCLFSFGRNLKWKQSAKLSAGPFCQWQLNKTFSQEWFGFCVKVVQTETIIHHFRAPRLHLITSAWKYWFRFILYPLQVLHITHIMSTYVRQRLLSEFSRVICGSWSNQPSCHAPQTN